MFQKYPLRIALMDNDFCALQWNASLIMRDPRTTLLFETESRDSLLTLIKDWDNLDIIVLDTEYEGSNLPILELIKTVRSQTKDVRIVCLSQNYKPEMAAGLINHGVDGLLIKNEIRMAIVPALVQIALNAKVVTPSIKPLIEDGHGGGLGNYQIIPKWKPNARLTRQILNCFWMRVFFGMRSPVVAKEIGVQTATVDKYLNIAYQILQDDWANDKYLFGLDTSQLSPEDEAFVWFTLPPLK